MIDKVRGVGAGYPALFGMPMLLIAFLAATVAIHPTFDSFDAQSVAMAALPLACASAAQAVVGKRPLDRTWRSGASAATFVFLS